MWPPSEFDLSPRGTTLGKRPVGLAGTTEGEAMKLAIYARELFPLLCIYIST